jgi:hypothetical protein
VASVAHCRDGFFAQEKKHIRIISSAYIFFRRYGHTTSCESPIENIQTVGCLLREKKVFLTNRIAVFKSCFVSYLHTRSVRMKKGGIGHECPSD